MKIFVFLLDLFDFLEPIFILRSRVVSVLLFKPIGRIRGHFVYPRAVWIRCHRVWKDQSDITVAFSDAFVLVLIQLLPYCWKIHWLFWDIKVSGVALIARLWRLFKQLGNMVGFYFVENFVAVIFLEIDHFVKPNERGNWHGFDRSLIIQNCHGFLLISLNVQTNFLIKIFFFHE